MKTGKNKNTRKSHPMIFHAVICAALAFIYFYRGTVTWFCTIFSTGIESIIYTANSPLKGGNMKFFSTLRAFCDPEKAAAIAACYVAFSILCEFVFSKVEMRILISVRKRKIFSFGVYRAIRFALCAGLFSLASFYTAKACSQLQVAKYISSRRENSDLYEKFYCQPDARAVKGDGKNLIYIYLESMETSYADEADGGRQPLRNCIPRMTELARENVNFSFGENLGGFRACPGATWTMGALFSTSSGIPFKFPIQGNSSNLYEAVGKNVVTLGDILDEKCYVQEFLCGSDGDFAGRKQFFEQHGGYEVFDLFTARKKGYIDEDYHVWWGFEDEILYKIARDELTRLASLGEKFNFTMLTVDTHHVGGYICKNCEDAFPTTLENVLDCADRQLHDFVEWIRAQEFFDETVIVISGDHPRMDTFLVEGIKYNERFVYNCFINAARKDFKEKGRCFNSLDMFPTVLSAMGFSIEGERLGLGTNLFSGEKTLCEELGANEFDAQLSRHSNFYANNFF